MAGHTSLPLPPKDCQPLRRTAGMFLTVLSLSSFDLLSSDRSQLICLLHLSSVSALGPLDPCLLKDRFWTVQAVGSLLTLPGPWTLLFFLPGPWTLLFALPGLCLSDFCPDYPGLMLPPGLYPCCLPAWPCPWIKKLVSEFRRCGRAPGSLLLIVPFPHSWTMFVLPLPGPRSPCKYFWQHLLLSAFGSFILSYITETSAPVLLLEFKL